MERAALSFAPTSKGAAVRRADNVLLQPSTLGQHLPSNLLAQRMPTALIAMRIQVRIQSEPQIFVVKKGLEGSRRVTSRQCSVPT